MPYVDPVTGARIGWVSQKPLFFTDATSLRQFIEAVTIADVSLSGVSPSPTEVMDPIEYGKFNTIEDFISAGAGARTALTLTFEIDKNNSYVGGGIITFASRTPTKKAETVISTVTTESLADNLMQACDRYAKPMGLLARHRSIPIVEPIDSKEESDRRSRWETNWKNIVVSAISGLLAGIVPLIVKSALHL